MTPSWMNWSGSVSCAPQRSATPTSEAELIALVRQAQRDNLTVRVAGTGHSFVPLCATDGALISLDSLQGVVATDRAALTATVWGGTKIHQLGEPLLAAGMAMENMGDIDRQSIAGAVSTGTHGTGHTLGNISTQVVGLRLITADGDALDCAPTTEPEIFRAAQVSLGLLGVVSQIALRLLPAYRLHERTWVASFDECFAQMDALIAENRHWEFFWSPRDDACAMKTLNPTTAEPFTGPPAPPDVSGRLGRYVKAERIDWSHRIFPSERNLKFNEMEFAVAAAHGPDCLCEIRQLMLTKHTDVLWPIEYRTLHSDDICISPASGRETIAISAHQAAELPHQNFFADVEAIFRNHHGRPHWGKLHSHDARELRDLYPQWERFHAVRARLDPSGRFVNDYLRAQVL
ncbi:MAG: D-arabinono-1,4-lactone oxidase [Chloroflexota bacterium]